MKGVAEYVNTTSLIVTVRGKLLQKFVMPVYNVRVPTPVI